jgi:hypothetical protein
MNEAVKYVVKTFVVHCPRCGDWTLFGQKRCPGCKANIEAENGIPFDEFLHPENYEHLEDYGH